MSRFTARLLWLFRAARLVVTSTSSKTHREQVRSTAKWAKDDRGATSTLPISSRVGEMPGRAEG
ncbi:hypothetical protein, partial [Mesorhizobium sp. M7A.F.Ca.US.007.01.1.1]|uniref:hypothetical protein n=1 Tax=Mesorhizobium sp. M7A.F.Ca.US.007.01.1.1 TaxID=2496712 RepID=UPI0019D1CB8F